MATIPSAVALVAGVIDSTFWREAVTEKELQRIVESVVARIVESKQFQLNIANLAAKISRQLVAATSNGRIRNLKQISEAPTEGLATVPQAAEFMSVSRHTVYRMMDADQLQFVEVRGAKRIPWAALHKLAPRWEVRQLHG